jgi:hypothetical protein
MFGPNLLPEKHKHGDRLQVWKNAGKYTLNKDSVKVVLKWRDQKALVVYIMMQGLLITALVCGHAQQCPPFWPASHILWDQSPGNTAALGPWPD